MTIRPVSTATSNAIATNALLTDQGRMNDLQNEVTTGIRINQPSDDPAGMVIALSSQSSIARLKQYSTNITDGLGQLAQSTASLSSIGDGLTQARALVLQAVNGTPTPATLNAISSQIQGIRANVLASMNSQYAGRPVFAGDGTSTQAYDASGTYTGNATAPTRTAAAGTSVAVGMTGPAAFGTGTSGVLGALDQIIAHLNSGTPADVETLRGPDLTNLTTADNTVQAASATTGTAYLQLQGLQTQNQSVSLALTTRLTSVQNVDMAQALTDLKTAESSYQAALYATAQTNRLSLVSFL
ncbi:flagellin [Acidothermaceae bacterium B102]|nr:flagellin [Acidothermaceae bacterium B102]